MTGRGPATPTFVYEIAGGLEVHNMVQVQGTSSVGGKRLVIELTSASGVTDGKLVPDAARSEIPFRCVFCYDGSWELFGRCGQNRVHLLGRADYSLASSGEQFNFQLVAFSSRFVLYHDDEKLCALNYLMPLSAVTHLALAGDASFSDIEFLDSSDFLLYHHPAALRDDAVIPSEVIATDDVTEDEMDDVDNSHADDLLQTSVLLEKSSLGGSQQSVAMTNPRLFDKLYIGGLIDLQQIEKGASERAPVAIRIGREICVSGRLSSHFEKFYIALSTVSHKNVPKLLQGEVTLLVSVQMQSTPTIAAYMLHGPVYTELAKTARLPIKLAANEFFKISIQCLYKCIAVHLNGLKCTNYEYNFFEKADRNLRFPLSQLHYLCVWGDIDYSSVVFHYPESLLIPYYNALMDNLTEYDRPEIRLQVALYKTSSRVSLILQEGEGDASESDLVIRCIIDVSQSLALFETERYGKLNDSKSIHSDGLRRLHGVNEFVLQLDWLHNRLNLFSNKVQLGSYDERLRSISRLTHVTIDGDFVLRNVEYFPKERKLKNPCCNCAMS